MPNVKAIMNRLEAERAAGKQRQITMKTKTVVKPMRDRTPPKPPTRMVVGKRAAAKPKTESKPAEPEKGTADDGSK